MSQPCNLATERSHAVRESSGKLSLILAAMVFAIFGDSDYPYEGNPVALVQVLP